MADKKPETLASAYAKAFAEIDKALKSSSNPHFKSKYADITAVIDSIKPALVKHGLFFTQLPSHHEAGVAVKTVLYSEAANGEAEGMDLGTVVVPVDRNNAQGYGSALTYARRYGLVTAFGVPTEDDDGNAAAAAPPKKREPAHSALKAKVREFMHELNGCGDPDELHAFITTKETNALLAEVKEKMPQWWEGWPDQPDGFTPLADVIDNAWKQVKEAA